MSCTADLQKNGGYEDYMEINTMETNAYSKTTQWHAKH